MAKSTKESIVTRQRVQFDFSSEALDRLEDLRKELDVPTKAEVVRNALKAYEWIFTQSKKQRIIEVLEQDGTEVYRLDADILLH
jgi:hypothetical protein